MLVFEERGKTPAPGQKAFGANERTNNKLIHIWRRRRDLNPGNIGWRGVLIPYSHYGVRLSRGGCRIFDWRRGEEIIICIWGVKSKCIWDKK